MRLHSIHNQEMLMSHVNYIQNEWTRQSARAEGFPTHVRKPNFMHECH